MAHDSDLMDPRWHERDRRLTWFALTVLIGFACIVAAIVVEAFGGPNWFPLAVIGTIFATAVTNFRVLMFPCPACGRPFGLSWRNLFFCNPVRRDCVHCGQIWPNTIEQRPTGNEDEDGQARLDGSKAATPAN
jgi:hypothetical protein